MAESMAARGVPVAVVPLEWYHWLPTMSTNSYRPILDAIDHTVQHVARVSAGADDAAQPHATSTASAVRYQRAQPVMASRQLRPLDVPPLPTSLLDMLLGKGGASSAAAAASNARDQPPAEEMASKVALVAHSAGGWLSRLYLSQKAHYGRTWDGAKLVNRLVTLGSPHVARLGPMAPHVARANDGGGALPVGVRCLTVASKGIRGKVSAMARASYHICAGPWANVAELDGDGITTADAALSVGGADQLVLEGVNHMPRSLIGHLVTPEGSKENPWYGSDSTLDEWLPWLRRGAM